MCSDRHGSSSEIFLYFLIFVVAGPVVEMKGDEMTRYGKMMDKERVDKLLFSSVKMSSGNSNWHYISVKGVHLVSLYFTLTADPKKNFSSAFIVNLFIKIVSI